MRLTFVIILLTACSLTKGQAVPPITKAGVKGNYFAGYVNGGLVRFDIMAALSGKVDSTTITDGKLWNWKNGVRSDGGTLTAGTNIYLSLPANTKAVGNFTKENPMIISAITAPVVIPGGTTSGTADLKPLSDAITSLQGTINALQTQVAAQAAEIARMKDLSTIVKLNPLLGIENNVLYLKAPATTAPAKAVKKNK